MTAAPTARSFPDIVGPADRKLGGGIDVIVVERHGRLDLAVGDVFGEEPRPSPLASKPWQNLKICAQLAADRAPQLGEIGIAFIVSAARRRRNRRRTAERGRTDGPAAGRSADRRLRSDKIVLPLVASVIGDIVDDHEAREMVAHVARERALAARRRVSARRSAPCRGVCARHEPARYRRSRRPACRCGSECSAVRK